jgi:hypothetical protein
MATDYDRSCLRRKFHCDGGNVGPGKGHIADGKQDEYIDKLEDHVVELEDKLNKAIGFIEHVSEAR